MPRTPEQIEADEGVTKAIEHWLRVYKYDGSEDDGGMRVLTDYVVLMATQGWSDDGDHVIGYPYMLRDSAVPHYRALGLIQVGFELLNSTMEDNDYPKHE